MQYDSSQGLLPQSWNYYNTRGNNSNRVQCHGYQITLSLSPENTQCFPGILIFPCFPGIQKECRIITIIRNNSDIYPFATSLRFLGIFPKYSQYQCYCGYIVPICPIISNIRNNRSNNGNICVSTGYYTHIALITEKVIIMGIYIGICVSSVNAEPLR